MPTNTTPEYKAAEAAFRRARDPGERLEHLREMLRTIPKHKGTEHVRADIKTKIKEFTEQLAGPRKGGARSGPQLVISPEGAAQIALIGPPNTGKSALHDRLTGSHAESADYPFTTQFPLPGMMPHLDIMFQLVDLPPISPEHPIGWIANALQPADAALLVADLGRPGCMEEVMAVVDDLGERRVILTADWDRPAGSDDPFAVTLPTLLLASKADLVEDPEGELEVFEELTGLRFPFMAVSTANGAGLDRLGDWLFERLGIVRVYSKVPGEAADDGAPFTVRRGETVVDVARQVHRDFVESLKFARVWGDGTFDGQQVGRDHVVHDGDIVELHV